MSLLHQESPDEIEDDAARGEELTKGTSHVVWATIIAVVVMTAVIAIYAIVGQKPPVATGEIVSVVAHPHHAESSGLDANGEDMAKVSFDQVLVFVHIKLHNQSPNPLKLLSILTNAKLDDGIHSSYAALPTDYQRLFVAYPGLAQLQGKALSPEATIDPGQTAEGDIVSSFRMSKQEWEARKDLSFTFSFEYQPQLTLAYHSAVIEQ
jgi:hypothetical protein